MKFDKSQKNLIKLAVKGKLRDTIAHKLKDVFQKSVFGYGVSSYCCRCGYFCPKEAKLIRIIEDENEYHPFNLAFCCLKCKNDLKDKMILDPSTELKHFEIWKDCLVSCFIRNELEACIPEEYIP